MFARSVVVVEDEDFLRSLVSGVLERAGFSVQSASNAAEARVLIGTTDPDVVVLDIDLGPGPTGLDIGEALLAQSSKTAVVYLTMLSDPRLVEPRGSVHRRAAYLNKRLIGDETVLIGAIEAVLHEQDLSSYRYDQHTTSPLAALSDTQLEILRLIAEGYTNQQIAERRSRSLSATEGTISRLFLALGIDSAADLNARVLAARNYPFPLRRIGTAEP